MAVFYLNIPLKSLKYICIYPYLNLLQFSYSAKNQCIYTNYKDSVNWVDYTSKISSDDAPNTFLNYEKYFQADVHPLNRGRYFSYNPWEGFRCARVNIAKERLNYKGKFYGSPWKH